MNTKRYGYRVLSLFGPRTGLQPAEMNALRTEVFRGRDGECAICLEQFVRRAVVRVLRCGHQVHADGCADVWFATSRTCPLCRASASPF